MRAVVLGLAVAAAAFLVAASGVHATTQPGTVYIVRLLVNDRAVVFRGDKFLTAKATPRYPRGTEVRYEVWNRGTRWFNLNMLGSTTGAIAPGKERSILVYWARRGNFVFRAKPHGPKIRVSVD